MKSKVKISLAVILVVILGIPPLLAEGEANPPQGGKAPAGQVQKPSQKIVNTYYIWSYDGKLLAEYDQDNNCTREYIYAGNQLVAEYHPMTDK